MKGPSSHINHPQCNSSHLSHISLIPSAEGISSLIWYFLCARLISGVTSQPLRLTATTACDMSDDDL